MVEIIIHNASVRFRSSEPTLNGWRNLFNNLSVTWSLESGEILGLMGESASGKSTLLRTIAGVQPCSTGGVTISSAQVGDIAFLPQGGVLLEHLSLHDNLTLFSRLKATRKRFSQKRLMAAVKQLDLSAIYKDNRSIDKLSGGERQRVALARVLSITPRLVLLDEPCAAVGGDHRTELLATLKKAAVQLEFSVVIATHDWSDHFLVANKIAFLKHTHGKGLATIPLYSVTEFAARPWHNEAMAYTANAPVNWIEATRNQSSWIISKGGVQLGQVNINFPQGVDQPGTECGSDLRQLLLACTPEAFTKNSTMGGPMHELKAIGKSDVFTFAGAGSSILIVKDIPCGELDRLRISGSAAAFGLEGNLVGIVDVSST